MTSKTPYETTVETERPNVVSHDPDPEPWVEFTATDDGPRIEDVEASVIAEGEETDPAHSSGPGLVSWIVTRYGGRPDSDAGKRGWLRSGVDSDRPPLRHRRRHSEREPTVLFR